MLVYRQLEAIVRISESLAKMSMLPFATEVHVDEALRLFQVSTLEAAQSGKLAGEQAAAVCRGTGLVVGGICMSFYIPYIRKYWRHF